MKNNNGCVLHIDSWYYKQRVRKNIKIMFSFFILFNLCQLYDIKKIYGTELKISLYMILF